MRRRPLGRALILAGVAVWVLYGALRLAGSGAEAAWFLPFHLVGVVPGFVLSRWDWITTRRRRAE